MLFFFFKQKTAYEMRISDWSSDVCSSDLTALGGGSVRDVLLGHYPLTWVKHPEYLVLTTAAAMLTVILARWMRHLRSLFLVLDAVGLEIGSASCRERVCQYV